MKETEQKKKGQYFTPDDIVDKMINFTDLNWKGNIYEPTAGDGNIFMKIIDKKVSLGMTPQEAIDTTYANEFDTHVYDVLTARLKSYCDEHRIYFRPENTTNLDARTCRPSCDKYEIITNLPFGSWSNSSLPKQIINNYSDIRAVYLTKWTTGCYNKYVPHVKKFENVIFPGIAYDTLLWEYDPEYTEGDIWIYWPLPKLPNHKLKNDWKGRARTDERRNTKCQIKRITRRKFRIRECVKEGGYWCDLNIPEEAYEEIKNKLHGRPYTGIHGEIMNTCRTQGMTTDVIYDYLYCNGFDYLFEE